MAYSQAALATIAARPIIVVEERDVIKEVRSFSADFYAQYKAYIDRKATTVKGYDTCIRQFARWMADNGITQPQRDDIMAYRDYLTDSGLATGTQSQYLRAVKHFFKWLAAERLYPNVGDGVHGAKVRHDVHKKDALQREDVAQIAASIDRSDEQGRRLYAMYLLCLVCGLRTIEVHRADVGDLKTKGGTTYLYLQGKGHDDKDAPVEIIPEVKAAIDEYLQTREAKPTAKSPLFTSTSNRSKGGRIATTTISTMIKDLLVRTGNDSDRLTAHSLRHTSGTGAHKAGCDLYETQHAMRHKDPATTEIYVHDDEHDKIEHKCRRAIYDYYFNGVNLHPVMPELEAAIMTLTLDEQRELLEQIRAQKGDKTA